MAPDPRRAPFPRYTAICLALAAVMCGYALWTKYAMNRAHGIEVMLDTRKIDFQANDLTLAPALEKLDREQKLGLKVNWEAINEEAGIAQNVKWDYSARQVPISWVLRGILGRHSYGGANLTSEIMDDGTIYVSSAAELQKRSYTQAYDIRDLLAWRGADIDQATRTEDLMQEFARAVERRRILPRGERWPWMQCAGTRLIVTQTKEGHQRVRHALAEDREQMDTWIAAVSAHGIKWQ